MLECVSINGLIEFQLLAIGQAKHSSYQGLALGSPGVATPLQRRKLSDDGFLWFFTLLKMFYGYCSVS